MAQSPDDTKAIQKARLEKALLILENETKRRVELVRQQVQRSCEAIIAKKNERLSQISKADQKLTVSEYCKKYGLNTINDIEKMNLQQQKKLTESRDLNTKQDLIPINESLKKSPNTKTQDSPMESQLIKDAANKQTNTELTNFEETQHIETQSTTTTMNKRMKVTHDLVIKKRQTSHEEIQSNHDNVPLIVHFESEDHATVSICLDPNRAMTRKFKVNATTDVLKHWNDAQRTAVRDQIQDLQDQLTQLKESLL